MTRFRDELQARAEDATSAVIDGVRARNIRVLAVIALLVAGTGLGAAGVLVAVLDDPVEQSGSVTYRAPSGAGVTIDGETNFSGTQLFPDQQSVQYVSSAGNLTVSGSATANVTVATENITGPWTRTTAVDAAADAVTINPEDKREIAVEGSAGRLDFREPQVDDGAADLRLDTSGGATVTVRGLPSETSVAAVDGDGSLLDTTQATAGGSGSFDIDSTASTTEVHFRTASGAPQISRLAPAGNLSSAPSHVAANITDADFPGDEVTVTFRVNGDVVGEKTVSEPGRVNTSFSGVSSGSHDVSVTAEDAHGLTTSESASFSVPSDLSVWNASNPNELVNEAEITVFAGERVFNRSTTNGTIDLTGLPAGERLTVQVSADGYRTRTVVIRSLASQQDVFLLPENASVVETDFLLDDKTGDFSPESTVIRLSAPIQKNGTTRYETVAADTPGQSGFIVDLRENVRYRISVQNEQGDVRDLDTYTPQVARTVELTVGDVQFGDDTGSQGVAASASLNTSDDSPAVQYRFRDVGDRVDELEYRVVDGEGNVVQANQTVTDPNTVYDRIPVADADGEYHVEWTARQDGEVSSGVERVGSVPAVFGGGVLDGGILELIGWIMIAAFGGLLVITDSRIEGIGVVVVTAILVILGAVQSIPMVAVSLAGTAAVLLYFGR